MRCKPQPPASGRRVLVSVVAAIAVALVAAAPASAARFPAAAFERNVERNLALLEKRADAESMRAARTWMGRLQKRVDAEDRENFRYRRVHSYLARSWDRTRKQYRNTEDEGLHRRLWGKRRALEVVIRFVERAGRARGIRLPSIMRAGDEG